jgi:hypothetical protein
VRNLKIRGFRVIQSLPYVEVVLDVLFAAGAAPFLR